MINPFKKIEYVIDRILDHARNVGRSKDALTFLTATAAILYIISSTLGSGSYKETNLFVPSLIMNNVIGVVMYALLMLFVLLFSFCLLSYLSETLEFFKNPIEDRFSFRFFPDGTMSKVIYISAIITSAVFAYALIRKEAGYETSKEVELLLFCLIFMVSVVSIYAMERFLAISDPSSTMWYFIIIVTSATVCFTIYRDSYKASFNENSRYCYWISEKIKTLSVNSKDAGDVLDYKICEDVSLKGVDFDSIKGNVIMMGE